jgi:hypothetical protein
MSILKIYTQTVLGSSLDKKMPDIWGISYTFDWIINRRPSKILDILRMDMQSACMISIDQSSSYSTNNNYNE